MTIYICPDCGSYRIEGKGWRYGNHRFICLDCGRNFTVTKYQMNRHKNNQNIFNF